MFTDTIHSCLLQVLSHSFKQVQVSICSLWHISLDMGFNLNISFITDETDWADCDLGSQPSQVFDFPQTGWDLGMATLREPWAPRIDPISQAAASHGQIHSLSHTLWHVCQTHFLQYIVSLRLAFSHWFRLCVTRTLFVIFPCHSMMLSHHT